MARLSLQCFCCPRGSCPCPCPGAAAGRVEAGRGGAASAELSSGIVLIRSRTRCPVSAVSPILSGTSHCWCAETILPSSSVGLLRRLPCAVLQPHGLTHPEPLPGRRGCHYAVWQGARRAPEIGPGLASALRHECNVFSAEPHVTECFFCGRVFPLTCCCSHRRGETCAREGTEHVSEQMVLIGRGIDYFFFFCSQFVLRKSWGGKLMSAALWSPYSSMGRHHTAVVPLQGRDVTGPSAGRPRAWLRPHPHLGLSVCIQALFLELCYPRMLLSLE